MAIKYSHVPHPNIRVRRLVGPPTHEDAAREVHGRSWFGKINNWVAVKITQGVGTMWCAYVFAALALVSLPAAIKSHNPVTLVSWISQTFLQLVLLSVIIVGQNIQAAASDRRAQATFDDASATLHEAQEIQSHLKAQDDALGHLLDRVQSLVADLEK